MTGVQTCALPISGNTKSDRFRNLTTFGTCKHFSRNEIESSLTSLIDKNLIKNINNLLVLTEKGIELFTKYTELQNKELTKETENYELNVELYNRLREIRKNIAFKYSQTPNLVCDDSILREISVQKPKTPEQLFGITGFNQRMFNKLGIEFLEIINNFVKEKKLDKCEDSQSEISLPDNIVGTYKLLKRGYNLGKIADFQKAHESIIALQIESIIEYLPNTDISNIINQKDFTDIKIEYKKGVTDIKELRAKFKGLSVSQLRIAVAKIKHN